jgi:heterodisulfide reductase subunit C2
MSSVNLNFKKELKQHGVETALQCFNCGTCAAICPIVYDNFPRRMIRYIQIGDRDRILQNADELWRCLHCGLCTKTCPRDAEPAEIILSLKRFVVANRRRS